MKSPEKVETKKELGVKRQSSRLHGFVFAFVMPFLPALFAWTANGAWAPGLWGGFHTKGYKELDLPPTWTNTYHDAHATTNACLVPSVYDTNDVVEIGNVSTVWSANRVWSYWGQICLEAGTTTMGGKIDDIILVEVDGVRVFDSSKNICQLKTGTVTFERAGWHDFRLVTSNGGGVAGVTGEGVAYGLGFAIKDAKESDWFYPADDGRMSRFRREDGTGFDHLFRISGDPRSIGGVIPAYGLMTNISEKTELACSAPLRVDTDSIRASFAGYALYDVDGETDLKTETGRGESNEITYVHGSQMGELIWKWKDIQYHVRVSAGAGGRVGQSKEWLAAGETVTISAIPDEGKAFVRWIGDVPEEAKNDPTITLPVSGPMTLTASFDPTVYVSPEGDDSDGSSWATAYRTIDKALDHAKDGATIKIAAGRYPQGRTISLSRPITLQGGGGREKVILDGLFKCQVLVMKGCPDIMVTGLTVEHGGNFTGSGMQVGSGIVSNCIVRNCHARANRSGGGVHLSGSSLVTHCVITNNVLDAGTGAGVYIGGGTLRNCLVAYNEHHGVISGHGGGGICSHGGTIENCTIVENRSDVAGGAGTAIDLGCEEFDTARPACGFSVTPTILLAGESCAFSSVVYGAPAGAELTYRWTLTNKSAGGEPERFEGTQFSKALAGAGWYDVTLDVTDGAGFSATMSHPSYIHVAPKTLYLADPDGPVAPAYPWDTPEKGATNLLELVAEAIDGSTIIIPEGVFPVTGEIRLDHEVTIRGAGMEKMTIVAAGVPEKRFRLLYLNHPGCIVEDLGVNGAIAPNGISQGDGVLIGAPGGILRRCLVTGCSTKGYWQKGIVALTSPKGLISQCAIRDNASQYTHGTVYISAGILENSLVQGNSTYSAGGVSYSGGIVRNCTIVDNTATSGNGGGIGWGAKGLAQFCLQNLIVDGNHAPNDTGAGSPEWSGDQGQIDSKTTHCYFGHGKAIGQDRVIGDIAFKDPAQGDYTLTLGSAAVDAGAPYDGMAAFDLLGKKRLSGEAVDLGCYELDQDAPTCGFSVAPDALFEGETVSFSSTVSGAPDPAALSYDWTLTSQDGLHVIKSAEANPTMGIANAGWYDIELFVTDKNGLSVTAFRPRAIHVAARESYLAVAGASTPTYPWKTAETASTNLFELLAEALDGTTIHLAQGEFKLADEVVIDRGITLKGAGMDKTVMMQAEKMGKRLFRLNHPRSVVEGLTIKGVHTILGDIDGHGDGIWIAANGGTVRHCRVTECLAGGGYWHHGFISITSKDGYVSHCVIDHNESYLDQKAGIVPGEGAVYLSAGRCENSLIYSNRLNKAALVLAGNGLVRNCTIADNSSVNEGAGFYIKGSAPAEICFENLLFAGNRGPAGDPSGERPEWSSDVAVEKIEQKITHCLFGDSKPIGLNARTGDPLFLDAAGGDYRVRRSSPAHDTGLYGEWMDGATDLAGNPRVDYKTFVDIGCYEATYVRPSTILMLR